MTTAATGAEDTVLVLASEGEARALGRVLLAGEVHAAVYSDVESLVEALDAHAGALLLAHEMLDWNVREAVVRVLAAQPDWSDLAVIVLVEDEPAAAQVLADITAGNVSALLRPVADTVLVGVIRAALRSRNSQYRLRDCQQAAAASEPALRQREARLRKALAAGNMGTWELDLATRAVTASEGTEVLFGFRPMPARPFPQYLRRIHPEDRHVIEALLPDRDGRVPSPEYTVEFRVQLPDGATRWVVSRGEYLHDAAGRLVGIAGATGDITEYKRVEAALHERSRELSERVKELRCLYRCFTLLDLRDVPLDEQLQRVASEIVLGFRDPDQTCARICLGDRAYVSRGFRVSSQWISATLHGRAGAPLGHLDVFSLGAAPGPPFSPEDHELLGAIADRVGSTMERRAAEDALRESEGLWRTVTESLAEGVVVQRLDGILEAWNPSAEALLRRRPGEMSGLTSTDASWQAIREDGTPFPGEEHPAMVTLATGQPCHDVVMGLRHGDGETTWISINTRPIFAPGAARPHAVVSSFSDITPRKRFEHELAREIGAREREHRRLRVVLEALPVGVFIADAQGRIVETNPAVKAIWGDARLSGGTEDYGPDYRGWWADSGEPVASDDWALARALNKGETSIAEEIHIQAHDGQHRTILNYGFPIRDSAGEIEGAVAVNVDITERKRGEEQRAYLAAIVSSSQDAIIAKTLEGIVTSWNAGAQRLYGYAPEEIIGKPIGILYPPELAREGKEILRRVGSGERFEQTDTLRLRKDGARIHVSVTVSPVRDDRGQVIAISDIARDITERKRLEEKLQYDAFHDQLTGLANRALFLDRLEHVIARSHRLGEHYAVLVLDLDDFKDINDTYGHLAGDQVLCEFSRRVQAVLRPVDTMARFGGDEFTVLLEEVDGRDAVQQVVQRIRDSLGPPFPIDGRQLEVASSIGVAIGNGVYRSADEVLRDADAALYQAKRAGKNRAATYDGSP